MTEKMIDLNGIPIEPQRPYSRLHPETMALVSEFALALADKLALAEQKYGYADNWATDDWEDECRTKLLRHLSKGDPLDVAAYCAFMWKRGWTTSGEPKIPPSPLNDAHHATRSDGLGPEDIQDRGSVKSNIGPRMAAMTPEQQRRCQFMGFDPDNPDVPLD